MPGTMPYSLEKGPYFEVLESYLNESEARLTDTLDRLRKGNPITSIPMIESTTLDVPGYDLAYRVRHVSEDWFGMVKDASGSYQPQPAFDPVKNPTTGFWQHWYGDAEGIFRAACIRALEVALGLEHGQAISRRSIRRHWPIYFLWKCPQPWYEGWISWEKSGSGPTDGQVTFVFATPGHGEGLRNTPLRPAGESKVPAGYEFEPRSCDGDLGLWVVTHAYQAPRVVPTTIPTGMGAWPSAATLGNSYQSSGPVVCVAPPEDEGGVLPGGRSYQAPTQPHP